MTLTAKRLGFSPSMCGEERDTLDKMKPATIAKLRAHRVMLSVPLGPDAQKAIARGLVVPGTEGSFTCTRPLCGGQGESQDPPKKLGIDSRHLLAKFGLTCHWLFFVL